MPLSLLAPPVLPLPLLWLQIAAAAYAADGNTDGWDSGPEERGETEEERCEPSLHAPLTTGVSCNTNRCCNNRQPSFLFFFCTYQSVVGR